MTSYYADSSALVKRYVQETGSSWIQTLCDPGLNHVFAFANIGLAEIAAALAAKYRQGGLSLTIFDALLHDLQTDAQLQYWLIDVHDTIITQAIALTRKHKLRGYDAVHLGCALFLRDTLSQNNLPAPIFLSADNDLLDAALAEGFATDNPNKHS